MSSPSLLIELHFVSGAIDRFEVDQPDHARIVVEHLSPAANPFSGPPLILSEDKCLTSYKIDSIVRVDLSGPAAPNWPYIGNAHSITEVTEEEFEATIASDELAHQRLAAWQRPGLNQEGFTTLTLTSGKRIIWKINVTSTEMVALDAAMVARRLFGTGALHGRRSDGAVMLINMSHVSRMSFYPGPPKTGGRMPSVKRIS